MGDFLGSYYSFDDEISNNGSRETGSVAPDQPVSIVDMEHVTISKRRNEPRNRFAELDQLQTQYVHTNLGLEEDEDEDENEEAEQEEERRSQKRKDDELKWTVTGIISGGDDDGDDRELFGIKDEKKDDFDIPIESMSKFLCGDDYEYEGKSLATVPLTDMLQEKIRTYCLNCGTKGCQGACGEREKMNKMEDSTSPISGGSSGGFWTWRVKGAKNDGVEKKGNAGKGTVAASKLGNVAFNKRSLVKMFQRKNVGSSSVL